MSSAPAERRSAAAAGADALERLKPAVTTAIEHELIVATRERWITALGDLELLVANVAELERLIASPLHSGRNLTRAELRRALSGATAVSAAPRTAPMRRLEDG